MDARTYQAEQDAMGPTDWAPAGPATWGGLLFNILKAMILLWTVIYALYWVLLLSLIGRPRFLRSGSQRQGWADPTTADASPGGNTIYSFNIVLIRALGGGFDVY